MILEKIFAFVFSQNRRESESELGMALGHIRIPIYPGMYLGHIKFNIYHGLHLAQSEFQFTLVYL